MDELRKPKFEREPENVPGPFYVAKGQCIICMLPVETAPNLIGFHQDNSGAHKQSHCYFKKQPTTPEENELAIESLNNACCGALRYCGSDKAIIGKIGEGHNPGAVD